jgi:hypothetical protein
MEASPVGETCESCDATRPANQIPLAPASPDATVAVMRDTQAIAGDLAVESEAMLGDVRALAEQAGVAAGALTLIAPTLPEVTSVAALRAFLRAYTADTLARREWPVILRAWELARAGQARELVALDREWTAQHRNAAFAEASFRVGQRQLNKLRPLRHERVVQRYAAAVEAGEARSWHPLVYGLTLAVFSLPLRQGLVNYAAHAVAGMVDAVAQRHRLPAEECAAVLDSVAAELPGALPPLPGAVFAVC